MRSFPRILVITRPALALMAGLLIVAGCTSGKSGQTPVASPTPAPAEAPVATAGPRPTDTPSPAATPSPLPTPTSAPDPTPTPIPLPTPTPGPTAIPLPQTVLRPAVAGQVAYAGTELAFEISGLKPLERADIFFNSPGGVPARSLAVRADSQGRVRWTRDSTRDMIGQWELLLQGDLGSTSRLTYTLAEAELPTETVTMGETTFLVYPTPEAVFYFEPGVRTAAVLRVAEMYLGTLPFGPETLDFTLEDSVDFFLVTSPAALRREIRAAGADAGSGLEAGVSLFGFPRPGIYVDMSSPLDAMPHVVAHEVSHQTTARIEGSRNGPHWLEEGLADYQGFAVASGIDPDRELQWRRLIRDAVRRAVQEGRWVDLDSIAAPEVWFTETEFDRVELFYGEAYASVDYVAKTFGEQALRPLIEALADRPDEVDAVLQQLFALSFAEFQLRVQESVLQKDMFELEIDGIIEYARAMFGVLDDEKGASGLWVQYVRERQGLQPELRLARLTEVTERYQALLTRTEQAIVPGAAKETQQIFLDAFTSYAQAHESFLSFEREPSAGALAEGNQALETASFTLGAAKDRLVALLNEFWVSNREVRLGTAG